MKKALLAIALASFSLSIHAQTVPEKPRVGTATSTSQQGGLTAGYVENIHMDDLPIDPLKRDLSLKLVGFHNLYTGLSAPNASPMMFILDRNDRLVREANSYAVSYFFEVLAADPRSELPHLATCKVEGPDGWLIGLRYRSLDDKGRLQLRIQTLKKSDQWLLDQLCDGLNKPLSWLTASGGGAAQEITVGDTLFAEGEPSGFAIMSETSPAGSTEYDIAYGYWHEAFGQLLNSLSVMDLHDPKMIAASAEAVATNAHARCRPWPRRARASCSRETRPHERAASVSTATPTFCARETHPKAN